MKFTTEKESIDYIKECLLRSGYTAVDCTQSTNPYCYYDMDCLRPLGKEMPLKYRFELKRRDLDSEHFGDCIIESSKYVHMIKALNKEEIDKAFIINLFNDCWTISDIETGLCDITCKNAKHTTEFEDNMIIEKIMVHFKPMKKFTY